MLTSTVSTYTSNSIQMENGLCTCFLLNKHSTWGMEVVPVCIQDLHICASAPDPRKNFDSMTLNKNPCQPKSTIGLVGDMKSFQCEAQKLPTTQKSQGQVPFSLLQDSRKKGYPQQGNNDGKCRLLLTRSQEGKHAAIIELGTSLTEGYGSLTKRPSPGLLVNNCQGQRFWLSLQCILQQTEPCCCCPQLRKPSTIPLFTNTIIVSKSYQ